MIGRLIKGMLTVFISSAAALFIWGVVCSNCPNVGATKSAPIDNIYSERVLGMAYHCAPTAKTCYIVDFRATQKNKIQTNQDWLQKKEANERDSLIFFVIKRASQV